jgi:hypothetical protein
MSKKQSKRSGNNLYGSKGKPKCEACRTARRGVSRSPEIWFLIGSVNSITRMTHVALVSERDCHVERKLVAGERKRLSGLVFWNNLFSTILDGLFAMSLHI